MHLNKITDTSVDNIPLSFYYEERDIDLDQYDKVLLCLSGGKDSVACLLKLIKKGVPLHKIELHHHLIDGIEGSELMDWPCTEAYCEAIAKAFGLPIYYSWKQGGFEGEMLRHNSPTAPVFFEDTNKVIKQAGKTDATKINTRLKFPQVSADLSVRWCSSYVKIMVFQKMINNSPRFTEGKYLVVTGERAEESNNRAKYMVFEPHSSSCKKIKHKNEDGTETGEVTYKRHKKRYIDHYRPVHAMSEQEIWDLYKEFKVNPHPAYWLGWGRVSCLSCIFGSKDQWATIKKFMPNRFNAIDNYEHKFDSTINHKRVNKETVKISVRDLAEQGTPYDCDSYWLEAAMSYEYNEDIFLDIWQLPPGAFAESCGPT